MELVAFWGGTILPEVGSPVSGTKMPATVRAAGALMIEAMRM
jgi:hypothetical protein